MGAGGYISASGDSDTQRFAVNSTLGSVSTLFSIVSNDTLGRRDGSSGGGILLWQNETFVDGQAIFCTFGSILQACFNGQAPAGCEVVTLGAVPASDFSSSSSNSASTNSILSSEMTSTTSDPTSGYASAPNGPTTTPNGPSSGKSLTTTPSLGTLGTTTSMSIGTNPVYGSSTSAGQSASSSISSTASVYPTSTGAPSCDDRSSYDGTVNDNYLILCDTDLPGFDIGSVPASDLADCIGVCNAYTPSSEGKCVAVTFNSVSPIQVLCSLC